MWRLAPRRIWALAGLLAMTALALVGADTPWKKKNEPPLKLDETVANLAYVATNGDVPIEGVGLVFGLDNTGADAPPSWYRSKLTEEMQKAGVEHANQILKDKRFSIAIVRAKIPPGTTPADRIDVTLELPPACGTTSLAGGYLLQTRLREMMVAPGGTPHEGNDFALAQGPVLIGTTADPTNPKVARVLGGARIKKPLPFLLVLKQNRRSVKTAVLLENVINQRFHFAEGVNEAGAAKEKLTDQFLELRIPRVYHHNQDRFFRVVQLLPIVDSPGLRAERQAAWQKELLDPKTAGVAALKLEGMGSTAIELLKTGLNSPNAQVRFLAAESLAYLDDPSGVDVLADTSTRQREFRSYALAALAALDHSAAHMALRKLMDVADVEVRYGAFNALRTLDEGDPFLGRVRVLDDPTDSEDEPQDDSMAMALSRRRRNRPEDPFALYLVDCDGPPMIHVANTRRCEIVLFGRNQKLLTPLVLGNGPILLNASDGDQSIQISKIVPLRIGEGEGEGDTKVAASLELGDVVRQTANLGAKYPDLVTILQAAERQKNLPGPLVVDAVPGNSPAYIEAAIFGKDTTAKKDDAVTQSKLETKSNQSRGGLFDRLRSRFRR
jgi:flagellar basal body P-ring protein FlgI